MSKLNKYGQTLEEAKHSLYNQLKGEIYERIQARKRAYRQTRGSLSVDEIALIVIEVMIEEEHI